MDLYVTGGEQRPSMLPLKEWHSTKKAIALRIDSTSGQVVESFEYLTPAAECPADKPEITFKSASMLGDKLYVCTCTEVLVCESPRFRTVQRISLPFFNDLHHVLPTPWGTLVVVVTGLDMVAEITYTGTVLREWSATDEDPWKRFSRETDYRRVSTTQPHESHPNFAFFADQELWVTRCDKKDAICLTAPGKRIDISVSYPHDGHVLGDRVWFTTVDGHAVVAGSRSLKVEEIIDLNTIDNPTGQPLGWCRGLLPVSDTLVWVGFTQLRATKIVEKLRWVKPSDAVPKPTRIALYDLAAGRCIRELDLRQHGMDQVFSILPAIPVEEDTTFARSRGGLACTAEPL